MTEPILISAPLLIGLSFYLLIGLVRTMLKTGLLANQGKIPARNDDVAAFKYMMKHPTFGDFLFLPVQLFLLLTIGLALVFLKVIFKVLS